MHGCTSTRTGQGQTWYSCTGKEASGNLLVPTSNTRACQRLRRSGTGSRLAWLMKLHPPRGCPACCLPWQFPLCLSQARSPTGHALPVGLSLSLFSNDYLAICGMEAAGSAGEQSLNLKSDAASHGIWGLGTPQSLMRHEHTSTTTALSPSASRLVGDIIIQIMTYMVVIDRVISW